MSGKLLALRPEEVPTNKEKPVTIFSSEDLDERRIRVPLIPKTFCFQPNNSVETILFSQYFHDGSDNISDQMTLVARTRYIHLENWGCHIWPKGYSTFFKIQSLKMHSNYGYLNSIKFYCQIKKLKY